MNRLEILLSGEFRTGGKCAENWKQIPNANITLCIDSVSSDLAKSMYPFADIICLDYELYFNNSDRIYSRWRYYTSLKKFSDDQIVIVSRPDLYITNSQSLIQQIHSTENKVLIGYDDETRTANDVLFVAPFGILRRMIDEYSEFDNFTTSYKTHEYMYYCAKKFNATNPVYWGNCIDLMCLTTLRCLWKLWRITTGYLSCKR